MQKTNYTKWIIVIILILATVGIIYSFENLRTDMENDEFDPSVYFEGDIVTQEEIDNVLTKEEQEEIDRIYNNEITTP